MVTSNMEIAAGVRGTDRGKRANGNGGGGGGRMCVQCRRERECAEEKGESSSSKLKGEEQQQSRSGGGETAVDDNVKCIINALSRGLENTNKMRALRLNCTFNELKQKKNNKKMHRIKTEQKRMNVCDKSSSKEADKERERRRRRR